LPAFGWWARGDAYGTLQVAELLEGALGGALIGVEAALEAFQSVFEVVEGGAEVVPAEADVAAVVRLVVEDVVRFEPMLPEVGFDGAEAADLPLVVDQCVDEVALTRRDGLELGVVLRGELRQGLGVFAADDVRFGM
jgi:hypothetical protein